STASRVTPGEPVTIGRPLANTSLHILDSRMQLLPVGAVGELYIGGDGVARGYLNRPELTEERFVPDPFQRPLTPPVSPGRLYKTGDLARYLPDGRVECLGRVDNQVKVRGFRIELGEVENVLRQHASVAQALVSAMEDSLGEKRLVAYVISNNGLISAAELRDFLKSKLPLYMVPASFVQVTAFPLTPNGKIDLKQLPQPDRAGQGTGEYKAPQTPEELRLAHIWEDVLRVGKVGIDDNFFEIGGDSLSATRAFARANNEFGMALTLREMLERPTIRSLAELVAESKGTVVASSSPIPRQRRELAGSSV
ncbi:MAG: non-ribosomal peptide synthetase, partial [Acidobacteriota bacterium]